MKLGPHGNHPTPQGLEFAAHSTCVCGFDGTVGSAALEYLRVAPPGAIRLWRHYFPDQNLHADPVRVGQEILDSLCGYRDLNLYVQVYVGIAGSNVREYIPLLREVTRWLHARGVNVAGPGTYTGDFDAAYMAVLRDANWCDLDLWCVQAYWASAGLTRWNALRYRDYWKPGDPRVVIGECGRDEVRDGPNGTMIGPPGWKAQGVSAEEYVRELVRFDQELQRDPYVVGGVVYTVGGTPDWAAFELDGLDLTSLYATPGMVPAPVGPALPEGGQVSTDELIRWAADVWRRAGVPFNPDAAIARYWLDSARRGRYLGRPEGPEHPSESGVPYQEFAGAVLSYRGGQVSESLPF